MKLMKKLFAVAMLMVMAGSVVVPQTAQARCGCCNFARPCGCGCR